MAVDSDINRSNRPDIENRFEPPGSARTSAFDSVGERDGEPQPTPYLYPEATGEISRREKEAQTSTPKEMASCEGCGCEFVKTRRTQRFHSRKCGQKARERKRWSKRRNARLSGARLERYRSDRHWEQVRGDTFVICRECGGPYQTLCGHTRHVHKMTRKEYHRKWPGAPWATENVKAANREQQKRRRALEDPEKKKERRAGAREQQRHYRATHVEELRQWRREHRKLHRDAINKRKRGWYAAHRDEINRRQREQHAANRDERNAQQRAARAADPERFRKYGQKTYAKHRRQRTEYAAKRRQVAWRPSDWMQKPIEWRIIGGELLSRNDYMSNQELGRRLDAARILRCPYGETWQVVLRQAGRATNFVSDIRKWVNRPGKTPTTK